MRITATVEVVPHSFSSDILLAASLRFSAVLSSLRLVEVPVTEASSASLLTVPSVPRTGCWTCPPSLGSASSSTRTSSPADACSDNHPCRGRS